jgi:hypothetical protein
MLKVLEDNKNKERDLERERSKIRLLEKDLKLCEDSIMGIGMTRPPREEPEVEQKIKVEEPDWKRFKKDEVLRAKTREENIERDDKLAREEEKQNLAREEEKQNLAREKQNLAREKQNLAREKPNLAREEPNLAREEPNLAREKETLARDTTPARKGKAIQNIATGTTPARVTASSQVFTTAYTQSLGASRQKFGDYHQIRFFIRG